MSTSPQFDQFDDQPPFPPRDGYGRPLIVPPGGGRVVPYTRASTFARTMSDAGGLVDWTARLVALGIGRHEDLAAIAAGLEYRDPKLDEVIETAKDRAGGNAKANYGTAIHKFTDPFAPQFVPDRMRADVDAYKAELTKRQATVVAYDRFIVNDHYKVAGTFDAILAFPDGSHLMEDRKTGTIHPLDVAIQLAIYSGGVYYEKNPDDPDGDPIRTPLEPVNQQEAILTHIPNGEGRCDMYKVDLVLGREACDLAALVRSWRTRKDLIAPLPDRMTERQIQLSEVRLAIKFAQNPAQLVYIWEKNQDVWNDELSILARARKAALTGETDEGADEGDDDE